MKTEHCQVINVVPFLVAAALLFGLALAISPIHAAPAAPAAPDATFVVDTTTDSNDAAYQACTAAANDCSLRGAITKANALGGANTITLPAGTYTLTRAGASEDDNATGDLDFISDITLNGAGAAATIIDAGQLDRVLQVYTGTVTVDGVTLRNGKTPNDATRHCNGGGANNYGGMLTIANSVVSGNLTGNNLGGSGCSGGGTYNYTGTLTIENSMISSNTTGDAGSASYSGGHGGGIATWDGTLIIRNSTISGNTTGNNGWTPGNDGNGGGVFTNGGTTTIENSTISGNAARRAGGGAYNYHLSDAVTLTHVTLTNNTADSDSDASGTGHGGGLAWRENTDEEPSGFIVKNSIIAGNTDNGTSDYADCKSGTDFSSEGYNLVGTGTGCPYDGTGDQTTSNPRLDPLQDNGGPTETHAPQYNSPAVDAIPNGTNGCGVTCTTDQRGAARPVDGFCDIGAYESPYVFWLGTGADDYTTRPENWKGNAVPTADNIPVFMSTNKGATVQSSLTVAGWIVASSYSGLIQQNNDLTVNGDWTQQAGTFHGYNGTLDIAGDFDFSGGSFTAPLGLMIVSGAFDHTGGTFDPNGGRILLASTTDQTLASTFYDLTINDGLIGYWKLDEGSGATTADASGYGHDGDLYNSPVWSTSAPATMDFYDPYSLQFDRSGSAEYVLTDSIPRLDQAQALSLSAWVRLASTPGGSGLTYMRFITLENEKAVLRYYDDNGTGKLHFYMRIGGSIRSILVDRAWATNTWYHVAGTYDGSTIRLYLNGTEQGTLDIAGAADSGGWMRLSHSSNTEALDGLLDDVRIYDRALSPTEISDLAQGKHPQTSLATTTLGDALDVDGDLTLNSGTLDVSASNLGINVAGDFIRNGGIFTRRNGTVTFDGNGTQTLDTDALTFHNLTVNSGVTLATRTPFNASGTLSNNGTLQQTRNVVSGGTSFLWAGGYGGLSISGANLGETTVTIRGNQDCTTTPGETVRRCFDIAPANTGSALVQFYFAASELSGNDCNTLNVYHWNGSGWDGPLTLDSSWGSGGRACGSEPYSVRVKNVSDFSPFVLSDHSPGSGPTAVTLASFTATTVDGDAVLLKWETASEVDLLGFHLYRAETVDGPQTRLNEALLPDQAPGSPVGGSYEFVDESVASGGTYWYWLADVDLRGAATLHGPVSATVQSAEWYRIYLPLVSR